MGCGPVRIASPTIAGNRRWSLIFAPLLASWLASWLATRSGRAISAWTWPGPSGRHAGKNGAAVRRAIAVGGATAGRGRGRRPRAVRMQASFFSAARDRGGRRPGRLPGVAATTWRSPAALFLAPVRGRLRVHDFAANLNRVPPWALLVLFRGFSARSQNPPPPRASQAMSGCRLSPLPLGARCECMPLQASQQGLCKPSRTGGGQPMRSASRAVRRCASRAAGNLSALASYPEILRRETPCGGGCEQSAHAVGYGGGQGPQLPGCLRGYMKPWTRIGRARPAPDRYQGT